jgi:hypothetical protein
LILSCEDKKEANNGSEYDPSQPVTVTSFYPDEGGMATRIIINGSNFGSDKEKIRVWYNQKRASIIGSNGEHLYVVTPRQPGDTCVISVAVGNDSVVFEQPFIYHTMTTVTTIAGHKGTLDFLAGTLATAEFGDPQRIVVDDEGNVFGSHRKSGDNNAGFVCWMLNEEKDIVMQLPNVSPKAGAPTLDITGRIVTFPDDGGHSFYIFDADLQWAGRKREILHPTADEIAAGIQDFTNISYKTSLATCEEDSLCYTFDYNTGSLIKFDPVSRKGQLENQFTEIANSHGMLMFHPVEKHILYIGVIQRYAFYTYNIRTKELLPYAGTAGVSGWRDGHKDDAWFGDIGQFLFDEDLNLILSDAGNHCIRKITPDGQVSTIIGKPGVAGYVDGNPEDAEFNFPRGMAIDKNYNIYISDTYNNCIRKLSVE